MPTKKTPTSLLGLIFFLSALALVGRLAMLQMFAMLWVPASLLLLLLGFPWFAMFGGKSLFKGLFDLNITKNKWPLRIFVVTLSAYFVAWTATGITRIVVLHGPERLHVPADWSVWPHWLSIWANAHAGWNKAFVWDNVLLLGLAAYIAGFAMYVSRRGQTNLEPRPLWKMGLSAMLAMALGTSSFVWVMRDTDGQPAWLTTHIGYLIEWMTYHLRLPAQGYTGAALPDHARALDALLVTLLFYVALGLYGFWRLGKPHTVPSLAAGLMALMVLGWQAAALEFFLAPFHLPLLVVLLAIGALKTYILKPDHTYSLMPRSRVSPALPVTVLNAHGGNCAIVLAAAGGGIQAAAWTAQVLEGLHAQHGDNFLHHLRMLSGISGGSEACAMFVNWMDKRRIANNTVRSPGAAAAESSLDEIAWGLAWPDLLRFLFPFTDSLIDRADAMEIAWSRNAAKLDAPPELTPALSTWNAKAADGTLPGLVMGSTVVEVGGPLLMGTTDVTGAKVPFWSYSDNLHIVNGVPMDVSIVRAARLSATFPYVTPVAHPEKTAKQPHMIDGGFYDNSGMATLSQWLDLALSDPDNKVEKVLILQTNGFSEDAMRLPNGGSRDWLTQLSAPLTAQINQHTAGQVSHGKIALDLLRDKWICRGKTIEVADFVFTLATPPLSWHLSPLQQQEIQQMWSGTGSVIGTAAEQARQNLIDAKQTVSEFLNGC